MDAAGFVSDTGFIVAAHRGQSPRKEKLSSHSARPTHSVPLILPVRTAEVLVTTMRPHANSRLP